MPEVLHLDSLFPETRRAVLGSVLFSGERWWYLTDLAKSLGKSPSSLQREMQALNSLGILSRRTEGRKILFRANHQSKECAALRAIFEVPGTARPKKSLESQL